MGEVYKARDRRLGREGAIKILRADKAAGPDRTARFLQEARAASALNHPQIIIIYDIGVEGGSNFLVMEYVKGRPLDQLIPRNGMPVRDRGEIPQNEWIEATDGLTGPRVFAQREFDLLPVAARRVEMHLGATARSCHQSGPPVQHAISRVPLPHAPGGAVCNSVARDKVVYTSVERTGNIWMMKRDY